MFGYDDKPIVACSSGTNENSAIGLIRLSGFSNLSILKDFFSTDLSKLAPNTAQFTKLIYDSKVLDEVVITFFKGPNSYNGENILEISAHGNIYNIKRIISSFVSSGLFRYAQNGEFTYRALKNRKLSLSQVEGLDVLLNASSSLMLDQGLELLSGDLFKKYKLLSDKYLKLKSAIEINIDFAEDVGESESIAMIKQCCDELHSVLSSLVRSANVNKKSFMSPNVILVGEPNAGKSSLFNSLLKDNRSIVSEVAGTTRDFISEYIDVYNVNYKLIDTAGLRITNDTIEEEGIKRALAILEDSFYKILIVDITKISDFNFQFSSDEKFDLLILNHCDKLLEDLSVDDIINFLPNFEQIILTSLLDNKIFFSGPMGAFLKSGSIGPSSFNGPMGADSKQNGSIGPEYSDFIFNNLNNKYTSLAEQSPILVDRHRQLLNEIETSYNLFISNISNLSDMAIISAECRIFGNKINELVGISSPDDVLNNIFSNFCIGK